MLEKLGNSSNPEKSKNEDNYINKNLLESDGFKIERADELFLESNEVIFKRITGKIFKEYKEVKELMDNIKLISVRLGYEFYDWLKDFYVYDVKLINKEIDANAFDFWKKYISDFKTKFKKKPMKYMLILFNNALKKKLQGEKVFADFPLTEDELKNLNSTIGYFIENKAYIDEVFNDFNNYIGKVWTFLEHLGSSEETALEMGYKIRKYGYKYDFEIANNLLKYLDMCKKDLNKFFMLQQETYKRCLDFIVTYHFLVTFQSAMHNIDNSGKFKNIFEKPEQFCDLSELIKSFLNSYKKGVNRFKNSFYAENKLKFFRLKPTMLGYGYEPGD